MIWNWEAGLLGYGHLNTLWSVGCTVLGNKSSNDIMDHVRRAGSRKELFQTTMFDLIVASFMHACLQLCRESFLVEFEILIDQIWLNREALQSFNLNLAR